MRQGWRTHPGWPVMVRLTDRSKPGFAPYKSEMGDGHPGMALDTTGVAWVSDPTYVRVWWGPDNHAS